MSEQKLSPYFTIRPGRDPDLPAINEIYNYYVEHTPITFDIEPTTMPQRREWMQRYAATGRHRLLVAVEAGAIVAYADTHQFRVKAAYDTTVETTVYCSPDTTGRGIGTALYQALFATIDGEDIRMAMAGITLPNDASIALHKNFGFTDAGVMHDVGRKFDQYWDVGWYEKRL